MAGLVFLYGTLMSGFHRPGRPRFDHVLLPLGRGWIRGTLYDLGIYPAAVPGTEGLVWGEVYEMADREAVLDALDEIEAYNEAEPDTSLYHRVEAPVTLDDGRVVTAWVYFYNAPLGRAERIESGDYLEHLKVR
jgi:gamma-glutamylcyclotransferase (GGCT)/AIG2-like uncharacterized protein YtfP